MSEFFKWIKFSLNLLRCLPHLILYYCHSSKYIIRKDITRWLRILGYPYNLTVGFIYLLAFVPEYRNLFYVRIGGLTAHFLKLLCPEMKTLNLVTKDIGEGLFIRHGFASGISAKSIGKNCTIYQQVSIGSLDGFPTILDNVTIYPGAVILGDVRIGNNVIIGANSSVFQDIPDNSTVYPALPKIMRWSSKETLKNA